MKGRYPVPAVLNVLHGNPSRRPINEFELSIPAIEPVSVPPPPDELDDTAQKEWKRIVKLLIENRMITELDLTLLTTYCYNFSMWIKIIRELQKGLIIKNSKGSPIQNPHFMMLKNTEATLMRCMQELGLSPVARARMKHSIQTKEEDFEEF